MGMREITSGEWCSNFRGSNGGAFYIDPGLVLNYEEVEPVHGYYVNDDVVEWYFYGFEAPLI